MENENHNSNKSFINKIKLTILVIIFALIFIGKFYFLAGTLTIVMIVLEFLYPDDKNNMKFS